MKTRNLLISVLFYLAPMGLFAGWQVAAPQQSIPREPFFQAGNGVTRPSPYGGGISFPHPYAAFGQPAAIYAISLSGSLKENIERIMGRYHWRVVWKAPYDYNFDGRVTGSSLPNVLQKLLQPFPLQAVMYMSNRTVAIVPRFQA